MNIGPTSWGQPNMGGMGQSPMGGMGQPSMGGMGQQSLGGMGQSALSGMGQPVRVSPEQLIQAMGPLTTEAENALRSGLPAGQVLGNTLLAGFLVGAGLTPAAAHEMVWQRKGGTVSKLKGEIEKAMEDEAQAGVMYRWLLERAPMELNDSRAVHHIRHALEDEQLHYRLLGELYQELTGRRYEASPKPMEPPPRNLTEGMKQALDGEYEAAEMYRDIYLSTKDPEIRDLFFHLMTDEMDHIPRFNYILMELLRAQS